MSLNPLAPAFLPQYQPSFDPTTPLCNSTTMSLPLVQLFYGMTPQLIPSHAPSINQSISDSTFTLPHLQSTSHSQQDLAAHQSPPGSSSLLSSPLQHQTNCLQAFHKTIQQFTQHLKVDQLDRKTLQLIALQLQNDFALLRYLLFSSVNKFSKKNIAVKNSGTSPLPNPIPNPNPNSHPTSTALPLFFTGGTSLRRSTPVGSVGPSRAKTKNSDNSDFQLTPNAQETPPTTV